MVTLFIKFRTKSSIIFIQIFTSELHCIIWSFGNVLLSGRQLMLNRSGRPINTESFQEGSKMSKIFMTKISLFPIIQCTAETVINQAIVLSDMLWWSNSKMTTWGPTSNMGEGDRQANTSMTLGKRMQFDTRFHSVRQR